MNYIIYKFIRFIGRPIVKLVYRAEYVGRDNIPCEGSVILAGNHTNNRDALLMIAGPKRIVHMMAKKELFNTRFKNAFFRSMGCISVNRSIHDENAKKALEQVINLKGCQVHSSVILSQEDMDIFRRLGIDLTCEPQYESDKLYHR